MPLAVADPGGLETFPLKPLLAGIGKCLVLLKSAASLSCPIVIRSRAFQHDERRLGGSQDKASLVHARSRAAPFHGDIPRNVGVAYEFAHVPLHGNPLFKFLYLPLIGNEITSVLFTSLVSL